MLKDILINIRLFPRIRKEPYVLLYQLLGFYPRKIDYYELAFMHKSISSFTSEKVGINNERLEFLGDAILNLIITDILYKRYSDEKEGFLTDARSKIVNRDSLNQLGKTIGLGKFIKSNTKLSPKNIYGNTLEALIGAIYLDYDYKKCYFFVEKLIFAHIDLEKIISSEVNYKSRIIEWCQKHNLKLEFITIQETPTPVQKELIFSTQLILQKKIVAKASGTTKKESQQKVSEIAYQLINTHPEEFYNEYEKQK